MPLQGGTLRAGVAGAGTPFDHVGLPAVLDAVDAAANPPENLQKPWEIQWFSSCALYCNGSPSRRASNDVGGAGRRNGNGPRPASDTEPWLAVRRNRILPAISERAQFRALK